jgi:hypothetical protein
MQRGGRRPDPTAEAVPDDGGRSVHDLAHKRRNLSDPDPARVPGGAVAAVPMAAEVDRDDPLTGGKRSENRLPPPGVGSAPVDQHQGRAADATRIPTNGAVLDAD